jgi:hypothetical protein
VDEVVVDEVDVFDGSAPPPQPGITQIASSKVAKTKNRTKESANSSWKCRAKAKLRNTSTPIAHPIQGNDGIRVAEEDGAEMLTETYCDAPGDSSTPGGVMLHVKFAGTCVQLSRTVPPNSGPAFTEME